MVGYVPECKAQIKCVAFERLVGISAVGWVYCENNAPYRCLSAHAHMLYFIDDGIYCLPDVLTQAVVCALKRRDVVFFTPHECGLVVHASDAEDSMKRSFN